MNQNNVTHLNRDVRHIMNASSPSFSTRPTNQFPPKKFTAKGHDAQLQDAQFGKIATTITLIGGTVCRGLITRRDKFTITLRHTEGTNVGMEEIFYKHAIEGVLIERADAQS